MNNMRNLEKLGILVIVILVVVVGVVAITPGDQLDKALDLAGGTAGDAQEHREVLPPDGADKGSAPDALGRGNRAEADQPVWPIEDTDLADTDTADTDLADNDHRTTPNPDREKRSVTPIDDRTVVVKPPVDDRKAIDPAPAPQPAPAAPRTYVTRKGDSFYRIAERELGHPRFVSALMTANPGIDPSKLGVGIKLNLPDLAQAKSQKSPETPVKQEKAAAPRSTSGPGGSYVVKKGDNLYDIARAQLGLGERWIEIARLNADLLKGSTRLSEGMKLRLPGSRGGDDGVTVSRDTPKPLTSDDGAVYVVRKNDTLSSIAASRLGRSSRWPEIVRANDDVLHGSDRISEGMKLKLPAK